MRFKTWGAVAQTGAGSEANKLVAAGLLIPVTDGRWTVGYDATAALRSLVGSVPVETLYEPLVELVISFRYSHMPDFANQPGVEAKLRALGVLEAGVEGLKTRVGAVIRG